MSAYVVEAWWRAYVEYQRELDEIVERVRHGW